MSSVLRCVGLIACGPLWTLMYGPLVLPAAAEEARSPHPWVAGFQRFHAGAEDQAERVAGGLLLLGELNCTSCHQADPAAARFITRKQAPLLGEVAGRVDPEHLRAFIAGPHAAKPGTTMPSVLHGLSEEKRSEAVEPLVHFLASVSERPFRITGPDGVSVARGAQLYHKAGCVACHQPYQGDTQTVENLRHASVPLGRLDKKYSITGLTDFLFDPLAVRPSGRMPQMTLERHEAEQIANYLLRDIDFPAGLTYAYYEGNWGKLPEFQKLEPAATGKLATFDLAVAGRDNHFALVEQGYMLIEKPGKYTFFLSSDDGSRLWIDQKLIVDNDGTHANQTRKGSAELTEGRHAIRLAFFQAGGPFELKVEIEGPGIRRRPVPAGWLSATKDPLPEKPPFVVDEKLARIGREQFGKLGCATCHQLGGEHKAIPSSLKGPGLANLKRGGCLADRPEGEAPEYRLTQVQRDALGAAISALQQGRLPQPDASRRARHAMVSLNCYGCHQRDQRGGVPRQRDAYFTANSPDLGDEGRLPPLLTGVGDKLKSAWLTAVLVEAGTCRAYMDARMPQFGKQNVGHLAADLVALDRTEPSVPKTSDPPELAKAAGRQLVGKEGLSCISCHQFGGYRSLGIQATDLVDMPKRLRRDWFHRYMHNPGQFRPGTRMPQAWPGGKSFKPNILDGDPLRQIDAIYVYLSDGRRAKRPAGLTRQSMELIVLGEALMYRNFIAGAGPRAIAVGYPELVSLAFDAQQLRLALLWQGKFIDASRHWAGRGQGFQPPLGKNVVELAEGPPLAVLEDENSPWPTATGEAGGYQFRGYELDELRRPTFRYDFREVHVRDKPLGVEEGELRWIRRHLQFTADENVQQLWFRAARAAQIERDRDAYVIDGRLRIDFPGDQAKPVVRQTEPSELLVPIRFTGGKAELVVQYKW